LQIRELVDAEPDVEYAPTEHLEALLVPPSSLATINLGNSNDLPVDRFLDEDDI